MARRPWLCQKQLEALLLQHECSTNAVPMQLERPLTWGLIGIFYAHSLHPIAILHTAGDSDQVTAINVLRVPRGAHTFEE